MKSIQDVIRQKELELQQALEDAVRVKELELVRLRKILQEALSTIDNLLEDETHTADGSPATAGSPKVFAAAAGRTHKSGPNNGGSEFP